MRTWRESRAEAIFGASPEVVFYRAETADPHVAPLLRLELERAIPLELLRAEGCCLASLLGISLERWCPSMRFVIGDSQRP